ncbi:MAG TPA: 16S rRNA (guanine(527)-N(7))-methyltransferase RsmG [Candidatus Polarisedimenticolia bacterium]|nr:16S rRNA (guanine(527)-N(7))-methyltransferase RsmG [Candidatus Polarisedimenticolia bacterium]
MQSADIRPILDSELASAGVVLPAEAVDRLASHARMVAKWNHAVRLVGSAEPAVLVKRHILESLAILPFIHEPRGALLDVGSGNGFPAIPLKCAQPDLRLAMMEPTVRKGVFLQNVIHELRLTDAMVIRGRVDSPNDLSRYGRWDCITMRAVAAIPAVLTGAPAALRPSGRLFFLVGEAGRDQVLRQLHQSLTLLADTTLPGMKASFLLVIGMNSPGPVSPTVH